MRDMAYQVGQVVFVILNKEMTVYPMQIVEIVNKRTLSGETTVYMVQIGGKSPKLVSIDDVDGQVYVSADGVRAALMDRVTNSVTQLIDNAVAKAKQWYPTGFETPASQPLLPRAEPNLSESDVGAEPIYVEIPGPDGVLRKAKVKGIKLPPSLS